jgi:TolB-like protein
MYKKLIILFSLNLASCTSLDLVNEQQGAQVENDYVVRIKGSDATSMPARSQLNQFQSPLGNNFNNSNSFAAGQTYHPAVGGKNVNHYVRGIMHDLVENMQYVDHRTPIAVTSFVFLDSDYNMSGLLGNQIAESFIHEVHKFGIPVVDYKTSDYIRVTRTGDYVFSRDFLDLNTDVPIKYILGGTLVKHRGGYLVNARVIGIDTKAVVASAQAFIPARVTEDLMRSDHNDGIPLISGE